MINLPVQIFSENILQYLQTACPDYYNELMNAITYEGLERTIIYDNRKQPIRDIAEITEDRQITIYENYIAFLWCLSFAMVTFYKERESDIDQYTISKLQNAISLLQYGYSLKDKWSEWPSNLPNPTLVGDYYVEKANAIAVISMSYILAHEIGHHILGHNLTGVGLDTLEAKQEEFSADKYAFDVIVGGYEEQNMSKNNSINVAIIVGLGSILLLERKWEEGDTHPNISDRLQKILQYIEDSNGGNEEYWSWGLLILLLWNVVYRNENYNPLGHGSHKADYETFAEYLKERQ